MDSAWIGQSAEFITVEGGCAYVSRISFGSGFYRASAKTEVGCWKSSASAGSTVTTPSI